MMATRLSDSELAARIRASNKQRAARQAERRRAAGKAQLNIWLTADTRAALVNMAAANGETLSDTAERLLLAGLDATTTPDTSEPPPVYTGCVVDKAELMNEVGKLLEEGHTGNEIARRLNASGRRTASGREFTGGNLLRDYRAWVKKAGAVNTARDTTPD